MDGPQSVNAFTNVEEPLCCVQLLAITNKAAVNTHVQIFIEKYNFLSPG